MRLIMTLFLLSTFLFGCQNIPTTPTPTSHPLLQSITPITPTKMATVMYTDTPAMDMTPIPTSPLADARFVWPTLDLTRWPATATATPIPADTAHQIIEKSYAVIQTNNANYIHQIVRYHRFELEDDYWGQGHHQPAYNVAPDNMLDVAFSPKNYLLVFGSSNGPGVWDISKYLTQPWLLESHPINIIKKFSDNVWNGYTEQVAFSPDGRFIALGNPFDDPTIQIVDVSTLSPLYPEHLRPIFVADFAFNPVNPIMGIVGEGLEFWNWQGNGLFPEYRIALPAEYIPSEFDRYDNTSIAFSPNGKLVATGGVFTHKNKQEARENVIILWDFKTGKVINLFGDGVNMGSVYSLSFNHTGNLLISGSGNDSSFKPVDNGGKVRVWDVKGGVLLATLQADEDTTHIVSFNPEGNIIVAGNQDGTIKLWDAKTFQLLRTIRAHIIKTTGISFSFDGRFIASSGNDGTVGIWGVCANAHGQQDYEYPCK